MSKLELSEESINTLEKNSEFTKKWIKGLRSGDYVQIQGAMVDINIPNSACCLMVAECVNGRDWEDHFDKNDGRIAHLPCCLHSLNSWTQFLDATLDDDSKYTPEEWNDTLELTFEEIADLLESGVVEFNCPED